MRNARSPRIDIAVATKTQDVRFAVLQHLTFRAGFADVCLACMLPIPLSAAMLARSLDKDELASWLMIQFRAGFDRLPRSRRYTIAPEDNDAFAKQFRQIGAVVLRVIFPDNAFSL
jgi:hypothetical protein